MVWTEKGAADNLVQHCHPGMKPETREKLEYLASSQCHDPAAREVAREGLANYERLEQERKDYEFRREMGWDDDS